MSKQTPFVQSDKSAESQIETDLLRNCPKALDLWLHFKALSSRIGAVSASQDALAKMMPSKIHGKLRPASRSTVHRAVKYLAKRHYIWIGKIGNQNVYIMNCNLVWQQAKSATSHTLKQYGLTFPAATVLTKGENRALFDEFNKFSKTGKVNLKNIKPKRSGNGKTNKNGEPIKRRRGKDGRFISKAELEREHDKGVIKQGWTADYKQWKRLRHSGYDNIVYQTHIPMTTSLPKNKKPVKNN